MWVCEGVWVALKLPYSRAEGRGPQQRLKLHLPHMGILLGGPEEKFSSTSWRCGVRPEILGEEKFKYMYIHDNIHMCACRYTHTLTDTQTHVK